MVVPERKRRETLNKTDSEVLEWLALGGNAERYEIAFNKKEYFNKVGNSTAPWTDRWLYQIPEPVSIRANSGHSGKGVCDDARGYALPPGFTDYLAHGSKLAFMDSITANGLMYGGVGGYSNRSN